MRRQLEAEHHGQMVRLVTCRLCALGGICGMDVSVVQQQWQHGSDGSMAVMVAWQCVVENKGSLMGIRGCSMANFAAGHAPRTASVRALAILGNQLD